MIERLLNSNEEPIRGKWYNNEESPEHQAKQGKIGNDPEDTKSECKSECNSASGTVDSLKVQVTNQKLTSPGPRTSRRQKKPPTTKNNDFLW